MAEPMITIKKADGTFAKVPLSEFKKIQAGQQKTQAAASVIASRSEAISNTGGANNGIAASADANQPPRNDNAKPAHDHHATPHHSTPHHAPVHHKIHTEHTKTIHHPKPMSRADAGSPLEEKLKIKSSAPLFSPKREKQVEEVLGKLGFSVMPDILGRLKSLVLAKLKDIKSEEETRELLARSIKNGGLGLTEQQVEKIIRSCREISAEGGSASGGEVAEVPALKGNSFSAAMKDLESELELPAPPKVISSPPFTKRGQGEMTIAKMVNESMANESVFKLAARPVMKQSMQDVTASSMEMGPVEEIKSITLTDFRRLSGNPEEAAKRLQQKMFTLQEESFVWYLEALTAYHNSPLYMEYIQSVCQSLAERKSLANVLSIKNSIKLNEAMALMEMERTL